VPLSAPTLRRVAALARTIQSDDHTFTLMSLEDHADGVVVRSHFDSTRVGIGDALAHLTLDVYDDRGNVHPTHPADTVGQGTDTGCALNVTWRSATALAVDGILVSISVPWLRVFSEIRLDGAVNLHHA